MQNNRFMLQLGAVFSVLFALFCLWQAPGILTGKLTAEEINQHLAVAEKNLTFENKERVMKGLRKWAEADDGKPVYMVNVMRYYDKLNRLPGTPDFQGTPQESNKLYEDAAVPMLTKNAGSLIYGSETQGANVLAIGDSPAMDNWNRVLVVRYPNRRAFLQLLSDPAYAPIEPYKLMALEVMLIPTSGDVVLPDLRVLLGGLLVIAFLLIGWRRAARHTV